MTRMTRVDGPESFLVLGRMEGRAQDGASGGEDACRPANAIGFCPDFKGPSMSETLLARL